MISLDAYWKGRDTEYAGELTDEIYNNALITVGRVNDLLSRAGRSDINAVNSGWRPQAVNDATSNAASASKHLTAEACDIADADDSLDAWCMDNLDVLVEAGLWMEHPGWTPGWCHVQTCAPGRPPRPQVRVYIPSSAPAKIARFGNKPVTVPVS